MKRYLVCLRYAPGEVGYYIDTAPDYVSAFLRALAVFVATNDTGKESFDSIAVRAI